MRMINVIIVAGAAALLAAGRVEAQHLWWDTERLDHATCLYGEITVLATHRRDLLLRRQLASRRASGRLLRHPAQQRERAPHDLLHLGHVAEAPSQA